MVRCVVLSHELRGEQKLSIAGEKSVKTGDLCIFPEVAKSMEFIFDGIAAAGPFSSISRAQLLGQIAHPGRLRRAQFQALHKMYSTCSFLVLKLIHLTPSTK